LSKPGSPNRGSPGWLVSAGAGCRSGLAAGDRRGPDAGPDDVDGWAVAAGVLLHRARESASHALHERLGF